MFAERFFQGIGGVGGCNDRIHVPHPQPVPEDFGETHAAALSDSALSMSSYAELAHLVATRDIVRIAFA